MYFGEKCQNMNAYMIYYIKLNKTNCVSYRPSNTACLNTKIKKKIKTKRIFTYNGSHLCTTDKNTPV